MSDLRIVKGNDFATLYTIRAMYADGTVVEDFDLRACTDVQVIVHRTYSKSVASLLSANEYGSYSLEPENVLRINWDGLLVKLGTYTVDFRAKFRGADIRSYSIKDLIFDIVETNEEANIPAGAFVDNGVYVFSGDFVLMFESQVQADWDESDTSSPAYIKNKPTIPSSLAELSEDAEHRTVTDAEIAEWNAKQDAIADIDEIRSGAAAGATAYQLPATGIPKAELSEQVQTSLEKADTAYQLPSGGVPYDELSQSVQDSLDKADTAYQKPPTGIPASDIASGVIPDVSQFITRNVNDLVNYTTTANLNTLLAGKQDTLTFDNTPTQNSNNPVKSGGVYSVINSLKSAGYVFAGVATPSTSPGTPTEKVFYIGGAGTYANFGTSVTVQDGYVCLFKYNGSWTKEQVMVENGGVFDISAFKAVGGTLATYADLATALGTNGVNIPEGVRKGGMSIKFVQSSDNKYIRYNLIADEFTTDVTKWAIDDVGVYVDNPEYIYIKTDGEGKILWAIKIDGGIYYGVGVPQQVIDYIDEKIEELSLDEYEDIVAFLNGLEEGDKTLQTLLNEKVDKEEGKSLIDAEYASSQSAIDNPEFLEVTTDSEDKVLEGIRKDGTKIVGGDLKVLGNIEVAGVSYKVIENPEYLAAWVDAEDKIIFGLRADGKTYVGDADFLNDIKDNQEVIAILGSKVDSLDIDALSSITATENPENISVVTDSEDKILAGRTPDGAAFENVGFTTPKMSVDGATIENIEDSDGRSEITTDAEDKIVSYRDSDGVKHEEVGISSKNVKTESINLSEDGLKQLKSDIEALNPEGDIIKKYDLPDKGTIDIVSEVFYLTANVGYSDKTGIYIIRDFEDTDANAWADITLDYYYVKSSLVDNGDGTYSKYNDGIEGHDIKLDFYAASKVTKVGNDYYVTSTLDDGQVVPESIQVTQIVDVPDISAWPVDKKTEHYCVVSINFGDYLTGNYYVGIKFQGSSTLHYRKRNFRFTFYKNSSYTKKSKIKIGEMPRTSGYNIKSFWVDRTRITEYVLNRVFMAVWETRNIAEDAYPWSRNKNMGCYSDATGMIKSFPIRVSIGNEFYGLCIFGLKKDEKNYLLDGDDDSSGIFVSGEGNNKPYDARGWADELGVKNRELAYPNWEDSPSVETAAAINNFFKFLVGYYVDESENTYLYNDVTELNEHFYVTSTLTYVDDHYEVNENSIEVTYVSDFEKSLVPEHLSIIDWIDYLICLEVFYMYDNITHNAILYSSEDKKIFHIFFYDLDGSLNFGESSVEKDVLSHWIPSRNLKNDPMWSPIYNNYKDELYERYKELRGSVLNYSYIKQIVDNVYEIIPSEWFIEESQKWDQTIINFDDKLNLFYARTNWIDSEMFNIKN